MALLAAFTLVWVLAVPCLTDGTEGNRMRYSVSPCVLLLAAWVAAAVVDTRRRSLAGRTAGTGARRYERTP